MTAKVLYTSPIRSLTPDKPPPPPVPTYHGVAVSQRAAAIVSVLRSPQKATDGARLATDRAFCSAISLPGSQLETVAREVRAIAEKAQPVDCIVIDCGSGLGGALWKVLENPRHDRRYIQITEQGRLRQTIIDSLIAAVARRELTFAPGLAAEADMRQALTSFRREIGEDGQLGSELVSALAVALHAKRRMPPKVY